MIQRAPFEPIEETANVRERNVPEGPGDAPPPARGRLRGSHRPHDLQRPHHEKVHRRRNRDDLWLAVDPAGTRPQNPDARDRSLRRGHGSRGRIGHSPAHGAPPRLDRRRADGSADPSHGLRGCAARARCLARRPRALRRGQEGARGLTSQERHTGPRGAILKRAQKALDTLPRIAYYKRQSSKERAQVLMRSHRTGVSEMTWETPTFVEVKMDAEINSYQE